MNCIKLAQLCDITAVNFHATLAEVKGQLVQKVEQLERTDPTVTEKKALFFLALETQPEAFRKILNTRALFNFFTGSNWAKSQFQVLDIPVSDKEVQRFIQRFLRHEIDPLLQIQMQQDHFESIALLTESHQLLPQDIVEELKRMALEKLDKANVILRPRFGNFSQVAFLKKSDFFHFLNHVKDPIIDEKVKGIVTALQFIVQHHPGSDLAKAIFTAMIHYTSSDAYLNQTILQYKETTELHFDPFRVNQTRNKWIIGIVAAIIVVRIGFIINENQIFDRITTQETDSYSETSPQIDPFYTNMEIETDSFQRFLTRFDPTKIRRLTAVQVATGDNPFETFYAYEPVSKDDFEVELTNTSGYDLLLLEHIILYDSIKMPSTAMFVPQGQSIRIQPRTPESDLVYNIYAGKKLASFQTDQLPGFVRSGSVVEYRFSDLIPNAEEIIQENFIFSKSSQIKFSNGQLQVE